MTRSDPDYGNELDADWWPTAMRIATWNLQSDRTLTQERKALFQQAMQEVDADAWVITESWTDNCILPGYRLVSQSCEAPDLKSNRRWVAIWSRLDTESLDVQGQSDRIACGRVKHSNKKDFVLIGTVLPWHFDVLWPNSSGYSAALGLQVAEWQRLSTVFEDCDLVVAGDFNQSLPHQRFYGSEQNATALNYAMECLDLYCSTLGNDPLTNLPRIDHLFSRRNEVQPDLAWKTGTWEVPCIGDREITDHSGSYVDFDVA